MSRPGTPDAGSGTPAGGPSPLVRNSGATGEEILTNPRPRIAAAVAQVEQTHAAL